MAKQHEVLAIKSGVSGKVTKLMADLTDLFTKKQHHFTTELVTYQPLKEGEPSVTEKDIKMQTTVRKELAWVGKDWAKLIDVCNQINQTNCVAKADVLINGTVILRGIPATGLLELEKQVATFKALLEKVPTLDPVKNFEPDSAAGEGVYKAQPRTTTRTAKEQYPLVLAPATDKHPAQVQLQSRDITVGHKQELEKSGMLTPAEKSDLLTRCEDLTMAIKEAQSRANNTDVTGDKIGADVVKFILG